MNKHELKSLGKCLTLPNEVKLATLASASVKSSHAMFYLGKSV